jgi:hypothetical protein
MTDLSDLHKSEIDTFVWQLFGDISLRGRGAAIARESTD